MSRPRQIRLKDQRDVYRLLMECCDLGDDPAAWRRRMFAGLCRLVRARIGIGGEMRDFGRPGQTILHSVEAGESDPSEREYRLRYLAEDGIRHDPVFQRFAFRHTPLMTRSLEQLIDQREWHASATYNRYMRPGGIDSRIISFLRMPSDPRTVNAITLHRGLREPRFSTRDVRLVHLFHHELGRQLGRRLHTISAVETARAGAGDEQLPRRLRQVLDCLVQGDSEKQVAGRLGLSPHTVHTYISRLHRRFDVQSRGELLARFIQRGRRSPHAHRST